MDDKARRVRGVFDSVAGKYDLMNDLMSGGLHRLWKHFTIEQAGVRRGQSVLDLAGGTGDLARKFAKQRPIQVRQRRTIEVTFNDSADVSKQTISVCRGLIELTSATHRTIAVVIGMALEFPIISHVFGPPGFILFRG